MLHNHKHSTGQNLKVVFLLNLGFTILEIIGGLYVNSVAIISDAIHDLGDSLSLGTAWYLEKKSKDKANKHFTFGYSRLSLLGALINSIVLILGSLYVINEAIDRILKPEHSDAAGMMIFAIIGIVINGFAAWKIAGGKTLNEKVITWHLLEDVLGWVAVFIVGAILNFKDILYLDPLLSILITTYILWGVFKRLKETLIIFLQGTPLDINLDEIKKELLNIKNIQSLHHTHVWSLEGEHHVFTTHLKLNNIYHLNQIVEIKKEVKKKLKSYPFKHYTIEIEINNETCELTNI